MLVDLKTKRVIGLRTADSQLDPDNLAPAKGVLGWGMVCAVLLVVVWVAS